MPSLWFVMPAHGRVQLAEICIRQLRRTCDALKSEGIDATAVVVADDENFDTARRFGFGAVTRDNQFVSRKFNDGIEFAFTNPRPADYVVPIGSDDWVDHRIFLNLPASDTVVGFKWMSFVREDAAEISAKHIDYPGGAGIRIYPRALMAPLGFRPADEDRYRGCDTSILYNLQQHHGDKLRVEHRHLHERQIVDWKTPDEQLNPYEALGRHRGKAATDPFRELAGIYPDDALDEMAALYASRREPVAA